MLGEELAQLAEVGLVVTLSAFELLSEFGDLFFLVLEVFFNLSLELFVLLFETHLLLQRFTRLFNVVVKLLRRVGLMQHREEGVSDLLQGKHARLQPVRLTQIYLIGCTRLLVLVFELVTFKFEMFCAPQTLVGKPPLLFLFLRPFLVSGLDLLLQVVAAQGQVLVHLDQLLLVAVAITLGLGQPVEGFRSKRGYRLAMKEVVAKLSERLYV